MKIQQLMAAKTQIGTEVRVRLIPAPALKKAREADKEALKQEILSAMLAAR
ncbi:unnamed protein product [Urochloa humidicola]